MKITPPFSSPSVFLPIRVPLIRGYFRRSSPWVYGAPRWMKMPGTHRNSGELWELETLNSKLETYFRRRQHERGSPEVMKIYPQISPINADYFHPLSVFLPIRVSSYQWLFSEELNDGSGI